MKTSHKEYIVYCASNLSTKLMSRLHAVNYWTSTERGTNVGDILGLHINDAQSRDYIISTLHKAEIPIYGYKQLKNKKRDWKQMTDDDLKPYIKEFHIGHTRTGKPFIILIKGEKK